MGTAAAALIVGFLVVAVIIWRVKTLRVGEVHVPIVVACIAVLGVMFTAGVTLFGYHFQKEKERAFELEKTQTEVYQRLTANIVQKHYLLVEAGKKEALSKPPTNGSDSRLRIMEHIDRYPELARNIREYNEITFSLSIYAPDRAVKAYAELSREMKDIVKDIVGKKPTNTLHLAKLTFELRRTVLPSTKVTEQDIKDILED